MPTIREVLVPDIGDFKNVLIIEVMVKPGDTVHPEQSLVTLETDKAAMDVPSTVGGVVQKLNVKVGDRVSEGTAILTVSTDAAETAAAGPAAAAPATTTSPAPVPTTAAQAPPTAAAPSQVDGAAFASTYASPAVRKLARELSVDLGNVNGSGDKGRILKEDVERLAKGALKEEVETLAVPEAPAAAMAGAGLGLLAWPKVDFAKFGPVQTKPLARIKKISGANISRNWVMIPHVTNHADADITDLEAFRVQMNEERQEFGVKTTMLAFLIKASVATLKRFPEFNSSLDGENLILKEYYHIGFAADTPNGLVVPVIRDADKKGVLDIAKEMGDLSKLARDGKLKREQMEGGCFTVSSLGGIAGSTYFTPIINAPEVAIMGVCRSFHKPVWDGTTFVPRLILPLSLSWDHRVVDGAAAARFNGYFADLLADMRRVLL